MTRKKLAFHGSFFFLMKFTSQCASKAKEITVRSQRKWIWFMRPARFQIILMGHYSWCDSNWFICLCDCMKNSFTKIQYTHAPFECDLMVTLFATCSDDRADFCAHLCISISIECCNATFSFVGQRHMCQHFNCWSHSFDVSDDYSDIGIIGHRNFCWLKSTHDTKKKAHEAIRFNWTNTLFTYSL